ncbi:hypothetical protein [Streptomyces sp. NRRL S-118]|uniref:COG1470 family protein n=1 Tax=Streptomyces sp. NRRL S-118 TaxID=1463881 RepID=UPI0004CAD2FC|nr:hypothetical protein [Streptomyces sp. NRRL S-118]
MTSTLTVTVTPEEITVGPGQSADVSVTVVNTGTLVSHYETTVVGLPDPDCFRADPPTVELNPHQTGVVTVRVSVPAQGEPYAGRHVLGVLVRKTGEHPASRCEELALTVPPVTTPTTAVRPEVAEGGPSARYAVEVGNTGNVTLPVTLRASDPENKVSFAFTPRTLTVAPGATASAELTAQATAPLSGPQVRRTIKVTAAAGQATAERQAVFVQNARVNAGLLTAAGVALGVLIMAGAVLGAALLVRGGTPPSTPGTPPTTKAPASGPAPRARIIDFSRQRGDQLVSPDRYLKDGVTVFTVLEQAPPECADATALALRTVTGLGSFLTSARPQGVDLCNTIPLQFEFTAPVDTVRLSFAGRGAGYALEVQLSDGSKARTEGRSRPGAATQLTYQAPKGLSVVSVVFGHADPSPTAKDPTIVKQLAYTPAKPITALPQNKGHAPDGPEARHRMLLE